MAIINRLARLFKADLHAVLDHIEEPELQLRQAVREMEEELAATDNQIQGRKYEMEDLEERKASVAELLEQTDREITVCFENDNPELARGLVRRKLESREMQSALEKAHGKAAKQLRALQAQREEFAALHESMQQKYQLVRSKPGSGSRVEDAAMDVFAIHDSDVEVALLQEQKRFNAQRKNA